MFDSIRSHRRWMMLFLTLLIFPSFVVTGIYGFTNMLSDNAVAKVGGTPVTVAEFENAQRERVEQMRQMFGGQVDAAMFDSPAARAATLDSLLAERSLIREADKNWLAIGPERMREVIAGVPAFQKDGRFDYETYKTVLASQGMTESSFESRVAFDLRRQVLLAAVADTAIAPKSVLESVLRQELQQREIRTQRFAPETFASKATVSDEAIKARYDADPKRFEVPETVKAEFLVLTTDDVARDVTVPADQIAAYYEQNKARFGTDEQRRASHILFTAGAGGSAADKAGARKLAEATLAKVRANPGSFAALAKELSKDPGSATNGGDLGYFGRNMMVKPFEAAVYALKPGDISDIVETDFGFHIIRLTEVKPAQVKPLAEVRAEIEGEFRRQQAQKLYAERAEQFTNLVYEQADSLAPAAERFKLQVQTIDRLTRQGVPARPGQPQLFGPKVVEALFSADAIEKKRNTAAIDVGQGTLISARVVDHTKASLRPLDEVKEVLRRQLVQEESARLAREAGQQRLAALGKAADDNGFGETITVSRADPKGLPPAALTAVLRVPADRLPSHVGVDLGGGAFGVVRVLSARNPEGADAQRTAGIEGELRQQFASADDHAYLQALKKKHDAVVLNPALVQAVAKPEDAAKDASEKK